MNVNEQIGGGLTDNVFFGKKEDIIPFNYFTSLFRSVKNFNDLKKTCPMGNLSRHIIQLLSTGMSENDVLFGDGTAIFKKSGIKYGDHTWPKDQPKNQKTCPISKKDCGICSKFNEEINQSYAGGTYSSCADASKSEIKDGINNDSIHKLYFSPYFNDNKMTNVLGTGWFSELKEEGTKLSLPYNKKTEPLLNYLRTNDISHLFRPSHKGEIQKVELGKPNVSKMKYLKYKHKYLKLKNKMI